MENVLCNNLIQMAYPSCLLSIANNVFKISLFTIDCFSFLLQIGHCLSDWISLFKSKSYFHLRRCAVLLTFYLSSFCHFIWKWIVTCSPNNYETITDYFHFIFHINGQGFSASCVHLKEWEGINFYFDFFMRSRPTNATCTILPRFAQEMCFWKMSFKKSPTDIMDETYKFIVQIASFHCTDLCISGAVHKQIVKIGIYK